MKPGLWAAVGAVLGLLVGVGLCVLFLPRTSPVPNADWKEQAQASTMPGRRTYTLPLNNPDMIPVTEAKEMKDEDIILGVFIQGEARAYPWWLTSNYHVVNDTVGDEPLLITLCEVCGGAAAFRPVVPELPGVALTFQICGVSLGTIELMDHQTHSKWRPFLGLAFEGPLQGKALENFPLLVMTWRDWKERYPMGLVANASPQMRTRPHGAEAGGHLGDPDLPPIFAATAHLTDHRLGTHELVFGIAVPETGKAYAIPVDLLMPFPNLFLVTTGRKRFLVARETRLAISAFDVTSTADGNGFLITSTNPLVFRGADGTNWNAFGVASAGREPGKTLPRTKSYLTEWYEWVSHSRESEIVEATQIRPIQTTSPNAHGRNETE